MILSSTLFFLLALVLWALIEGSLGIMITRFVEPYTRKFTFAHWAFVLPGILLCFYLLIVLANV